MDTLPQAVLKFHSDAEKKIFNALKNSDLVHATALHSLNLPDHQYKQWAEADFVVVSPKGILVLEVKGGGVRRDQGQWVMTDRHGTERIRRESPFDQAKGARFSVQERLEKLLPEPLITKINFGFGVMFPDVVFDEQSVEWDSALIFDAVAHDRRQISSWLDKLFRYWSEKTGRNQRLSAAEVATLVKAMRPELDRVPALISRVGTTVEQLVQLTEDQYRYLDGLLLQPRVVLDGGAGTGKTFLAAEAARRLSAQDKDVLYLCRSPVLAWNIKNKLRDLPVDVLNFPVLQEMVAQGKSPNFDILIVDEGQDFLDMDSILFIDSLFENGFENGNWLFFMDSNNQGSIYETPDADAVKYLQSAGLPWPLRENCRNTRQIATATMLLTGGDIGRSKVQGDGLHVDYVYYSDDLEAISLTENILSRWTEDEQILPGEITLLSMTDWENSLVHNLDKRWRRRIQIVDPTSAFVPQNNSFTFSNIIDFKGLESRYVLLLDLDQFQGSASDISKLYVGTTRANALVCMMIPKKQKSIFDDLQRKNMPALRAALMDEE